MELMDAYERYLVEVKGASSNTVTSYLQDVRHFRQWLELESSEGLDQARESQIQQYLTELQDQGRSNATQSHVLASLRNFYCYLMQQGLCRDNPASRLKVVRQDRPVPQILTAEEVTALLSQPSREDAKGIRDKAMLELIYATGLRVSELVGLDLEDVHLSQGTICCYGIKGSRVLPICSNAKGALRMYLEQVRPQLARPEEHALFLNVNGRRISRQGFWKLLKSYQQQANIKKEVTPHTLRHSFAVHLLEKGTDLLDLKERMGHRDICSTQRYVHLLEDSGK